MRRSMPDEEPEEEMRPVKLLFLALLYLAIGIGVAHTVFDGMARTQEQRETVLQTKLDLMKPGTSIKLNGYSYFKVGKGGYHAE